jgi:hypothetical protein
VVEAAYVSGLVEPICDPAVVRPLAAIPRPCCNKIGLSSALREWSEYML